jgi:predicted 2-oxoglutarate/Fe(II)-dependent dioxygenase YbiX/peroxiredoxin
MRLAFAWEISEDAAQRISISRMAMPDQKDPLSTRDISQHKFLPSVALTVGDRFPDFFLPDQQGTVRSFTERAKGNAIALLLDPTDLLLQQATERETDCAAAALDRLAIIGGSEVEVVARANMLAVGFPLLADSAGKIRQQLRQMSGRDMPAEKDMPWLILLDRQQRVLEIMAGDDLIAHALARWQQEPALQPAQPLTQFAPVLIIPNVLSDVDCQALMTRWDKLGHQEGTVHSILKGVETTRIHADVKSRRDHRIDDMDLHRALGSVIGRRLAPELERAFQFSRFRFDSFIVTCYDAERRDHFRRHRDNQSPSTADRRFALTLNLNTGDYEGGELIFPEFGAHLYSPPPGGAIVFSCSLLHEAKPVTRGRRFTLLSFLRS